MGILEFLHHFNLVEWVARVGYTGLVLVILAETGVFFAFFLPGDSLVFAAGILAAKQVFHLWLLLPLLTASAIAGYAFAYWFGNRLGHWLIKRPDSLWFKRKYITQAHTFYEHYGNKTLIFGRLVPFIRTFAGIVAGMAEMPKKYFWIYNIIGAIVWCVGITSLGYLLGGILPDAVNYLLPCIFIIVVLSIGIPALWHRYRHKKQINK